MYFGYGSKKKPSHPNLDNRLRVAWKKAVENGKNCKCCSHHKAFPPMVEGTEIRYCGYHGQCCPCPTGE